VLGGLLLGEGGVALQDVLQALAGDVQPALDRANGSLELPAHLLQAAAAHVERFQREPVMRFVAADVETANQSLSSICQIGIVTFDERGIADTWQTLINSREGFASMNVFTQGIDSNDEKAINHSPTNREQYERIQAAREKRKSHCVAANPVHA
jgi:hypothetical protein